MNDHGSCGKTNGFLPNGLLSNGESYVSRLLDQERWSKAEERVAELISCIQPNQPLQDKRKSIVRYVQHRIMKCFPCQVFTVGSVPLKTYLPDGDIDLTAFATEQTMKDTWASEVRDMLESEEKNEDAEFHVKEVQYIQAEVKIVKCIVENIVVDISFDQIGGLCTLCFLEEVDHLINQNHLFKRSILLIKAWCYHESRILGAHHGLISTYGLETMILYIFLVFNNSFAGPLEVLYRFLEFFSKFDWDKFCVSLRGPVPISSLPDIKADPPRKDSEELLLGHFFDACGSVYANFPGGQKNEERPFISKFLNVIDPLRRNNNLGRSVGKGNFFRIRGAFAFGAQQLARLLDCPKGNLISEVDHFFTNTWSRHGKCQFSGGSRPDLYAIWPVDWNTFGNSHGLNNFTSAMKGKNNGRNHASKVDRTLASCAPNIVFPQHGNLAAFSPQSQKTHGNPRTNYVGSEVHTAFPFSRTYSGEFCLRGRHIKESITWENYNASVRLNSSRDKQLAHKFSEKHSTNMPMPEILSIAVPNDQRNSAGLNVPKVCSFPVHQCPPNLGMASNLEKTNEWGFKGETDSRKKFDSNDSGNIIENGVLILETDDSKVVSTSECRSSRTKSPFKSNLAGRESKSVPYTIYLSAPSYVLQSQSCQVPTYFVEPSKQQEFDIMKSNFATHWKNLQHARLYQTLWNNESILFPSILDVLPVYLQNHFSPRDDPEGDGKAKLFAQTTCNGGRLVPGVPLPLAYERHSCVSEHGRKEVLRYPACTEIAAHNPNMTSFKDQRFSYTKKYTRNFDGAKGGNWNMNPNPQFDEENDKSTKIGRSGRGSFYSQNAQFGHSKISHNSDNLVHQMYELPIMNHNKVSPLGSNATSFVFGSVRPVPFSHTNEVSSVFGEGSSRCINA